MNKELFERAQDLDARIARMHYHIAQLEFLMGTCYDVALIEDQDKRRICVLDNREDRAYIAHYLLEKAHKELEQLKQQFNEL